MKIIFYRVVLIVTVIMLSATQYIDAQKINPSLAITRTESLTVRDCKISVFPNPVSEMLYINVKEEKSTYLIVDVLGQSVAYGVLNENKSVDVSGLNNGLYFMKLTTNQAEQVVRFIKS